MTDNQWTSTFLRFIATFFLKSQKATWEVFASIFQHSLGISSVTGPVWPPFRDFLRCVSSRVSSRLRRRKSTPFSTLTWETSTPSGRRCWTGHFLQVGDGFIMFYRWCMMIHILPFEKWWVSKLVSSSQTLKFAAVTLRDRPEDSQDLPGTREQLVAGGPQSTQLEASGRTDLGHFHCHVIFLGAYPHGEWIGYMMIYYVWYVYLIQLARHGARMRKLPHRKCGVNNGRLRI